MTNAAGVSLGSKVALVSGAARGIGRAVAIMLARHGADVALTDLDEARTLLNDAAMEIEDAGRRSAVIPADLRQRLEVDALLEQTLARFGQLDILVNVAGVHSYPSPLLTVTETEWNRVFDINVKGTLFMCQAALPYIIRRGAGSVINIASDSAFDVIADEGPYGISKIAVVRLSSYLAKELAGTGVRINSLAPGWVNTRMSAAILADSGATDIAISAIPARRLANPVDIAGVVLFLASDLANYVNGHCIVVDGGRVAGLPA
jgi:NAD(P)-dependent dehydrogenase (short-subunit alcohol dehydrogenase family)